MSKPIFKDMFNLDTRRNRKSYLMFHMLFLIGAVILFFPILFFGIHGLAQITHSAVAFVLGLLFFGAFVAGGLSFIVASMCYTFQRCNDIGISRLWAIASFFLFSPINGFSALLQSPQDDIALSSQGGLPLAITVIYFAGILFNFGFTLVMLFKKGQDGPNAFGPNPLDVDWTPDEGKPASKKKTSSSTAS